MYLAHAQVKVGLENRKFCFAQVTFSVLLLLLSLCCPCLVQELGSRWEYYYRLVKPCITNTPININLWLWTYPNTVTYNPYVVLCVCIYTSVVSCFFTVEEVYFITSTVSFVCYSIWRQFSIPAVHAKVAAQARVTFPRMYILHVPVCKVVYEYTYCGKLGHILQEGSKQSEVTQTIPFILSLSLSLSLYPLLLSLTLWHTPAIILL